MDFFRDCRTLSTALNGAFPSVAQFVAWLSSVLSACRFFLPQGWLCGRGGSGGEGLGLGGVRSQVEGKVGVR
jgi:hypothetical protein